VESALKEGNHLLVKEFKYLYLGVLNYDDLIISKLFRGSGVDVEDCLLLVKEKRRDIDLDILAKRFRETASYDISEEKVNKNFTRFVRILKNQGIYDEK
jgi:hypothetical protein